MPEEQKSTIEKLLEEWDVDSTVDKTEPGKEMLKIPVLHAKYIRILSKYNLMGKRAEHDFAVLRRQKSDYYNGRMSEQELKSKNLQPFKFVLKGEVWEYIDGDSDIVKLKDKIVMCSEIVKTCESILKELNQRTYQLTNYMKWEMFIAGQ